MRQMEKKCLWTQPLCVREQCVFPHWCFCVSETVCESGRERKKRAVWTVWKIWMHTLTYTVYIHIHERIQDEKWESIDVSGVENTFQICRRLIHKTQAACLSKNIKDWRNKSILYGSLTFLWYVFSSRAHLKKWWAQIQKQICYDRIKSCVIHNNQSKAKDWHTMCCKPGVLLH